ncbi:AraC family transcriptional regulator [Adhaeribacter radiodurans]|uniref:AraC family transcriptional regulator n=1 Tax=Adhaeribacter radiodurans TaxID=2745197 RepID=A0A7L7LAN0_9BACT|nr:AraC family transcriptional regulator [Adhaeribacter radiodurans]
MREFVQCYRIVHLEFAQSDKIPLKAYPPKPEQCLHFFLRDFFAIQKPDEGKSSQPAIMLAGQRTSLVEQTTGNNFINVQVVFQPTATYRLTGIPAYELTNQHLDATSIFHKNINTTFEQLQQAKNYTELLTIIESFCQGLILNAKKDNLPLDAISRQMIQKDGNISVDWLAKESCLCTKQFKRKFLERTGVNPKTYSRIIRFNQAFNFKNRFPQKDWLSIAIACGYYDYQHLVKDYKEFTGLAPNEFHLLESKSPESILGLADSLYRDRIKPII